MYDVLKWGILIGTLVFCSIQLSAIAVRLRNIDHAITVLTISKAAPELVDLVKGDMEEDE